MWDGAAIAVALGFVAAFGEQEFFVLFCFNAFSNCFSFYTSNYL